MNSYSQFYSVYGVTVESDRPIPGLSPAPTGNADVVVSWFDRELPSGEEEQTFREWNAGRNTCVRFARSAAHYILRFDGVADFRASADGSHVQCYAPSGVSDSVVRHAFLDQTLPLLLSRRSIPVFHASAVEGAQGALAFAGRSGHGKSTLACHFARHGFPMLSDDCAAIQFDGNQPVVMPGYGEVRLWKDSLDFLAPDAGDLPRPAHRASKFYYGGDDVLPFANHGVPLRRFYLLEPLAAGDFEIRRLTGANSLYRVIALQFLLDSGDPSELDTNLKTAQALVRSGLCYLLRLPRNLSELGSYADRIAAHVESNVGLDSE